MAEGEKGGIVGAEPSPQRSLGPFLPFSPLLLFPPPEVAT